MARPNSVPLSYPPHEDHGDVDPKGIAPAPPPFMVTFFGPITKLKVGDCTWTHPYIKQKMPDRG